MSKVPARTTSLFWWLAIRLLLPKEDWHGPVWTRWGTIQRGEQP